MRVLHVVRQFHPAIGGLESMVGSLTRHQRSSGLDVAVLTLDRRIGAGGSARWPALDEIDGVPVFRVPFAGPGRYPIAPSVLRHTSRFDIIHVHALDFFADYLAASAPLHRKPLVLSTHGGFFHTTFARRLKKVYFSTVTRATLSRYARVFACSEADASLFRPVAGDKVRTIENGVDTRKFRDAASPTPRPVLLALGRIAMHKGLDRLIAAVERAARQIPDIRLDIVGNDFDGTATILKRENAEAIATGRVRVLEGLDDVAARRIMSGASFIASASDYEGFGLGLVEGLSAGLVPIASPIPTFRDIIAKAAIGTLIDFRDADAAGRQIAAAVNSLTAEDRLAATRAADRWSWGQTAHRLTAEYEEVLGVRARRILGVKIAPLESDAAVSKIDGAVVDGKPVSVLFANAHALNLAARRPRLKALMNDSLVPNDGVGVDIASGWKYGRPFPANLNGTDFVPHFLDRTRHDLKIYLLGARPGIAEHAATYLAARWPRHAIAGTRHGYFRNSDEARDVALTIRQLYTDVVLVAMGNPFQEEWIAAHGRLTGARAIMGVGALFDFWAGAVPRAPQWVRDRRLEWLFRLSMEPRRLVGRYLLGNAAFLARAWRDRQHHEAA